MFSTSEIRTWVASAQLDGETRRTIESRLRSFEARRGKKTPVTHGDLKGWIFNGYPRAADALIRRFPLRDPKAATMPVASRVLR